VELHQTPIAAAAAGEELQNSAVEILVVAVEAKLQTVAEVVHQTAVAEDVALQIAAAVVEEGIHWQTTVSVAAAVPKK
jgi:hypothetical protein